MINKILPLYPTPDKNIVKSKGCYLYDANGKQYIDFESGVWCTNLGHCNKQINMVIEQQIATNMHHGYNFGNKFTTALAAKLNELIGFKNGQSAFLSSGSEAINLGISIARHLTGRKNILKVDNSFLSAYGFGRLASDNDSKLDIHFNDYESISKINFSNIAAFVVELGGASVDIVQFPEKDFINDLVNEAQKNGCLIIVDEVTTGFGRLGEWFAFPEYNILPDIVVTAKGLGNGYPISAVTTNSAIVDQLDKKPLNYAQSHINDPLGCAIGLEVIRIFEQENILKKCQDSGKFFLNKLYEIKNKFPEKVKDVRGKGLMLAVEFSELIIGEEINKSLFENGIVLTCKKNTLRLLPPLIIEKKDILKFVYVVSGLLSE